jgi:hypothetical protein
MYTVRIIACRLPSLVAQPDAEPFPNARRRPWDVIASDAGMRRLLRAGGCCCRVTIIKLSITALDLIPISGKNITKVGN